MSTRDKHNKIGFETPAKYFDNLADRLSNQSLESKDEKVTSGFEVPDGYFDGLSDRVMQNVQSSNRDHSDVLKSNDTKVIQMDPVDNSKSSQAQQGSVIKKLSEYALPIIGTAAAIVALITMNGINNVPQDTNLDNEALSAYVYGLDDYLDQETIDIMYDEVIVLDDVDPSLQIDDAALMDYLVNEMDMNQILSE